MVQANELRIGNKFSGAGMFQTVKEILDYGPTGSIQQRDGSNVEVDKNYSHLILVQENKNQYKPCDMEGIPLTPEILVAAGFKFSKGGGISGAGMWQGMAFWRHENINLRGSVSTAGGGVLHLEGYFNTQIQFVHQLQNLYFALTGKELPLSPPQPA